MNTLFWFFFFLSVIFVVIANMAKKKEKKGVAVFAAVLGGLTAIVSGAIAVGLERTALVEGGLSAFVVAYSLLLLPQFGGKEKSKKEHRVSYAIFSWMFYVVMLMAFLMILML